MSNQEIRQDAGFLPTTTTTTSSDHHRLEIPPSSSTDTPTGENLSGFSWIPFPLGSHIPSPPHRPTSKKPLSISDLPENQEITTSDSHIAAILRRAVSDVTSPSFQESLAAISADCHNLIRRTVSDTTSSAYQEALTAATTTPPRPPASARKRRAAESSNPRETPKKSMRIKKVEDMMREFEQKCREIVLESESEEDQELNNSENPSQVGEALRDEAVRLEWMGDSFLKIKLRCPCSKRYQFLVKESTCYYRLA